MSLLQLHLLLLSWFLPFWMETSFFFLSLFLNFTSLRLMLLFFCFQTWSFKNNHWHAVPLVYPLLSTLPLTGHEFYEISFTQASRKAACDQGWAAGFQTEQGLRLKSISSSHGPYEHGQFIKSLLWLSIVHKTEVSLLLCSLGEKKDDNIIK